MKTKPSQFVKILSTSYIYKFSPRDSSESLWLLEESINGGFSKIMKKVLPDLTPAGKLSPGFYAKGYRVRDTIFFQRLRIIPIKSISKKLIAEDKVMSIIPA